MGYGCNGLWLQWVTIGHNRLQWVTIGNNGLQ